MGVRIPEFKDYCSKVVLKSRIFAFLSLLLFIGLIVVSTAPKVAVAPSERYLLYAMLKYNYTPEDYRKTFLKWELKNPLIDKEKLIKYVEENRIYSYFRPYRATYDEKNKEWVIVGKRLIWTDKPSYSVLRKGKFAVKVRNVSGKFFVEKEKWLE